MTRKPRVRKIPPGTDVIDFLKSLDADARRVAIELLGEDERQTVDAAWPGFAHEGQVGPPGDWSTWVVMGGRGFDKTLAGAKWIESIVATEQPVRIALIGATIDDARRIMVEGKSGLTPWRAAGSTNGCPASAGSNSPPAPRRHYSAAPARRCCADPSIMSRGATNWPSGTSRGIAGTCSSSGFGSATARAR